jgi:hypothetical protein
MNIGILMARGKKSRTMKGKLGIKTGSKKDFIKQGENGKIPSHNRLDKHKKTMQKSAYQRHLEETNQKDTTSGHGQMKQRLQKAAENAKVAEVKIKPTKKEKVVKDFATLSGDELLDMFN